MMPQQHIIRRQVLELQFSREENAAEIRDLLSEIYRRRVVPLIDAYCSQLSDPQIRHRIECVEIDLGHLSMEALEETFVQRADAEIKKVLRASLPPVTQDSIPQKESQKTAMKSDLELWLYFLKTGVLPWWVVNPGPELLTKTLKNLLAGSARSRLQALLPLLKQANPRKRMIVHCSNAQLSELASRLFPENSSQWKPWAENDLEALIQHPVFANESNPHLRLHFWDWVLTAEETRASFQEKTKAEASLKEKLLKVLKTGLPDRAHAGEEVHSEKTENASPQETTEPVSTETHETLNEAPSWEVETLDPATGLAIWVHFFYTGSLLPGHFPQLDQIEPHGSPPNSTEPETGLPAEFWSDLFVRVWEALPEGMTRLLELAMGKPEQRIRFIATLPNHLLYQWMESWRPQVATRLQTWFRESDKELVPDGAFLKANPVLFRKLFWETIFAYLAEETTSEKTFDQEAFLTVLQEKWILTEAENAQHAPPKEEPQSKLAKEHDPVWEALESLHSKLIALTSKTIPATISNRIETTQDTIQRLLEEQNLDEASTALPELAAKYAALADQVQAFHGLFESARGDTEVGRSRETPEPATTSSSTSKEGHSSSPGEEQLPDPALDLQPPEPTPNTHFSEADALTVYNAGLILFWPYLTRFFSILELIDEEGFLDEESQTLAALLLEYIATGAAHTAEFQLPLNKILCGIPLSAPLDITVPIPDRMRESADELIQAVIQNWDALGTISVEGFRRTFLQREGILKTQDGQWRLHIENQTEDVLLKRIPWGIHMIKLPWMEALMTVEW